MKKIIAITESMPTMKILCEVPFKDKTITELELSGKNLQADGAMVVSHYIHDNGALASVNILNNNIGAEQAQNFVAILKEHAMTLKSLCGNKGDETELDMSGKKMGADGAIMLAPEIVANGALETITFGDNQAVTVMTDMTEADFSGKSLEVAGAVVLATFLPKCQ